MDPFLAEGSAKTSRKFKGRIETYRERKLLSEGVTKTKPEKQGLTFKGSVVSILEAGKRMQACRFKGNFLQYYQITSAIPAYLKSYASAHTDLGYLNSVCENLDFQQSNDVTLNLKKTFCKQFYKLFVEKINTEASAIKSWRKHSPEVAENWVHYIQNNYIITRDNKPRQFYFKLLDRILVTDKELKYFGITDCVKCVM